MSSYVHFTSYMACLVLAVSLLSCSGDSPGTPVIDVPDGWKLVWNDEFDRDGLPDPAKWGYDTGDHGWGNNERQDYTAEDLETARVEDGKLHIRAFLIDRPNAKTYRSARLVTRGRASWKYVRVEARAKLPGGTGTWPAIWMLPEERPYGNGGWPDNGEIDIMEYVGFSPGVIHGTVHTHARNHIRGTQAGDSITLASPETQFHIYAIEWFEDRIDFFVDDELYFTYANNGQGWQYWPFDQPFHLIMNIAVGGNWGGQRGVDDSIFPVELVVDYVRVFERI